MWKFLSNILTRILIIIVCGCVGVMFRKPHHNSGCIVCCPRCVRYIPKTNNLFRDQPILRLILKYDPFFYQSLEKR